MQIIFRTVRRFRLSLRPFGDLDSLWDSLKIHKSIEHCGDSDSLWDSVIIQIIFKRVKGFVSVAFCRFANHDTLSISY